MQKKRLQTVTVRHNVGEDDSYRWSGALETKARIYPLSGETAAQMYGLTLSQMRGALLPLGVSVSAGDGLCVFVQGGEPCDYVVKGTPEKHLRHISVTLEYIPEGWRGEND